jgi:hypothetical protein
VQIAHILKAAKEAKSVPCNGAEIETMEPTLLDISATCLVKNKPK